MIFVHNDYMVQTLPADRADQALHVCVLPGRPRSDGHLVDAHPFHPLVEVITVDAVAIPQQKPWRLLERKRLDHLPGYPLGRRVGRDVEVDDLASVMSEDQEDVEDLEPDRVDREEVDGRRLLHMVGEEGTPVLGRRLGLAGHVFGHGGVGHLMTQEAEFRLDTRRAPGRVLPRHAADQVANLPLHARPPLLRSGLPAPVEPEALLVPTDHRLRLDDQQGRPP